MKNIRIILACLISNVAFAQIGINTASPAASLDVVAKKMDGSTAEGFITPRLSGDQIKSADAQYGAPQTGAIVYAVSAVNGSTAKTINITATGFYYFDGNIWQKMGSSGVLSGGSIEPGDIKNSVKAADHNGWYLLNGRTVASLPANAQIAANDLGFTTTIPNATDRVLKTKSAAETIGATGGANSLTLLQTNLPNVNLTGNITGTAASAGVHTHTITGTALSAGVHTHAITGTALSAGAHAHNISGSAASAGNHNHSPSAGNGFLLGGTTVGNNGTGNYQGNNAQSSWGGVGMTGTTANAGAHTHTVSGTAASAGAHTHTLDADAGNAGAHTHVLDADAANAGAHTHTVTGTATVSTGGAGTALDNRSPYLVVNTFIYLGQ
jgi:hypothetical protein